MTLSLNGQASVAQRTQSVTMFNNLALPRETCARVSSTRAQISITSVYLRLCS